MIIAAIKNLVPKAKFIISGDCTYAEIVWQDNRDKPSKADVDAEIIKVTAKHDAQEYARNRKEEYNALNQLELMTDDAANSTTSHATAVGVIKTKWPKDNSGPIE